MKKLTALLLALVLCLSLSACGQSEAAKAADAAIEAIGEVTYESGDAIRNAEALYEALEEKEKNGVRHLSDLIEAREAYNALVEAPITELLGHVTALNDAVTVMDVAGCYAAMDAIRAAFDAMEPALYDIAIAATQREDGVSLPEALEQYEAILIECCVNDTHIALPAYTVTYPSQGAWLVNDHGDFAAYNWWAENESDLSAAMEEYKAYVSANTAITETADGFTFTDNSGNTVTVLVTDSGILQVRVPRF